MNELFDLQFDTVDHVIDFWNDETDYTYNFLLLYQNL